MPVFIKNGSERLDDFDYSKIESDVSLQVTHKKKATRRDIIKVDMKLLYLTGLFLESRKMPKSSFRTASKFKIPSDVCTWANVSWPRSPAKIHS
jgi:hypothetical protein